MKNNTKFIAFTIIAWFLFSTTSCMVLAPTQHHDNGKHKGWYKNENNPHNTSSMKVKGKTIKQSNNGNSKAKNKK